MSNLLIFPTETYQLKLFNKIITLYCENHMKHINTLCVQNAELLMLKQLVHLIIIVV
jgi:hypothetical protein